MELFKKSKKKSEPKPIHRITAVAMKRSNDPYLFEFELFALYDAREEADGRVSFEMSKIVGPYGMIFIGEHAYSYLVRNAFQNSSSATPPEEVITGGSSGDDE